VEPADREAWLQLRNALWPSPDHSGEIETYFRGTLAEPDEVFLAFTGGQPVGLLELSVRNDVAGAVGIPTGYIEGLYVVPEARSFRTIRMLVDAACRWALEKECRAFASDRVVLIGELNPCAVARVRRAGGAFPRSRS
jgi:aminoglycoside 6'-N-acetyltransferase I